MAVVIDVARRHPDGARVDAELTRLGLSTPALAARGHRLVEAQRPAPTAPPRLAIVLSRVSLGSDVATSCTIMRALLERDPATRVAFVGGPAAAGLVAGNPRIAFAPCEHPRGGDLLARMHYWLELRRLVGRLSAGLADAEWLVVEADSRLTQLGMLPLAPDERSRYFVLRTVERPGRERLADLAGAWAAELVGADRPPLPCVWPSDAARDWAAALRAALDEHRPRWALVSFGVGGKAAKGLGADFETRLLRRLADHGLGVLLSRGVNEAEVAATRAVTDRLAAAGLDVLDLPASGDGLAAAGRRQIVTWQAPTDGMLALVEAADVYVGYDSSGQHVAAAVGTPGVTAFVVEAGERHFRRWSPAGRGQSRVVRVEPGASDLQRIVDQVVGQAADLLAGSG
jgi:ADP-heptose:LPS heptosyltransferase